MTAILIIFLCFPADELETLKHLVQSRDHGSSLVSADETLRENGVHQNGVDQPEENPLDQATPTPIQFLLNVG